MQKLHLATSSLNLTPLDWEGNFEIIKRTILRAKESGVDLLCLPELAISGYGCEDMFFADWVMEKSLIYLEKVLALTSGFTCILGCPVVFQEHRYNCAIVISNGSIAGIVPKQYLANSGVYYEGRWFTPWRGEVDEIEVCGERKPFGKLIFEFNNIRFGIEVCEDAWVGNRPLNVFKSDGVQLVVNPSASHFSFGKTAQRQELITAASRLVDDMVYVYSNHQGNEAGRLVYDGGGFISKGKRIVSSTKRFSFTDFEVVSSQLEFPIAKSRETVSGYKLITLADLRQGAEISVLRGGSGLDISKEEEFTLAVSLSLFDYLRKSKHKAFVVSLSGGADSSACTVLSKLAIDLAIRDRGVDYVSRVLAQDGSNQIDYSKALVCAYLRTENSSEETYEASRALAENLGARFLCYDLDSTIQGYVGAVEKDFGKLSWSNNDIPLQNIQARSRGPLIWLITNVVGGLLLATSNRSEAAVGYTTMDGDTCGGISPIGGINKSFLLNWLKWISNSSGHAFGDFYALEKVLGIQPTAELRPKERRQSDEADLMPYEILDFIEKRFVLDRKNSEEMVTLVSERFSMNLNEARGLVSKFLNLWSRSQWKRERYAPSFHLDEENLDPKTWCRYPILSGNLV